MELYYRGESMHPLFRPGDVLDVRPCVPSSVRAGDVIVFVPPGEEKQVVHRVCSGGPEGFRTKGDNNPQPDPWGIAPDRVIGRVVSVRRAGRNVWLIDGAAGHAVARFIGTAKKLDHRAAAFLHPLYRRLARCGLFRRLVPFSMTPRVISVRRAGGVENQVLMGRHIVGRREPGAAEWKIRRPFRLFVDEKRLPVGH